jgi:pyridoxal phosphate enzyme (YggS family)
MAISELDKEPAVLELNALRIRLEEVRSRIAAAALRAGRAVDEIKLVAISKTHPASMLRAALSLGVHDLGENRVQEAEPKIVELGRKAATWHLVGHLQSNKARRAVQLFDVIHSLDTMSLAQRLERVCQEEQKSIDVLIQVDLGGEETKSGLPETELLKVATVLKTSERVRLIGLMTLPPYFEDGEQVRPFFRRLRELRNDLADKELFKNSTGELSMGMTHDFEVAVEEGGTMLRIGTAIFGERGKSFEDQVK